MGAAMTGPHSSGSRNYFQASRLEGFYNDIRLSREIYQRASRIHGMRQPGILKDYLEIELIVALHFYIANPANKFCLVFYRIPYRRHDVHGPDFPGDLRKLMPADLTIDPKSDGMFVIRHLGESTKNVIASGIGIRSRVWLMSLDCAPEPLIDPSTLALQEVFKVDGSVCPRVI